MESKHKGRLAREELFLLTIAILMSLAIISVFFDALTGSEILFGELETP